jgi:hypothetical protein
MSDWDTNPMNILNAETLLRERNAFDGGEIGNNVVWVDKDKLKKLASMAYVLIDGLDPDSRIYASKIYPLVNLISELNGGEK